MCFYALNSLLIISFFNWSLSLHSIINNHLKQFFFVDVNQVCKLCSKLNICKINEEKVDYTDDSIERTLTACANNHFSMLSNYSICYCRTFVKFHVFIHYKIIGVANVFQLSSISSLSLSHHLLSLHLLSQY
jgi:hypothetical protein